MCFCSFEKNYRGAIPSIFSPDVFRGIRLRNFPEFIVAFAMVKCLFWKKQLMQPTNGNLPVNMRNGKKTGDFFAHDASMGLVYLPTWKPYCTRTIKNNQM